MCSLSRKFYGKNSLELSEGIAMLPKLIRAAFLVVPIACGAATSTMDAFDYKRCVHWVITSDYAGDGVAFEKASAILQKLKQSGSPEEWYLLEGNKLYEEHAPEYGVCSYVAGSFTCHPSSEFVLAGTTFTEQGELGKFKCTKGCEKLAFNSLYERGYEDGPDSKELAPAARKFETTCHEKRKNKEFLERYRRQISK